MIQKLLDADEQPEPDDPTGNLLASGPEFIHLFDLPENDDQPLGQTDEKGEAATDSNYESPTAAESVRMSSLAWSAGIVLFTSIAFMLVIGWFADLLLGSSPWGIVVGIVIGSIIGFVQLFRVTSQIFKK